MFAFRIRDARFEPLRFEIMKTDRMQVHAFFGITKAGVFPPRVESKWKASGQQFFP